MSESLFVKKTKSLNLNTIIIGSFPSGGYFDEVVNNKTIYQGYQYDIHSFILFAVIHFMDGEEVCQIN